MLPDTIVERARKGDRKAIVALIKQRLQLQGIKAETLLIEDCLQVMLTPDQPVDQDGNFNLIYQVVKEIDTEQIKTIQMQLQKSGKKLPRWMQRFERFEQQAVIDLTGKVNLASFEEKADLAKILSQYEAGARDFSSVNLCESDLRGIKLGFANLQKAQLTWSNLSGASLGYANLSFAKLNHANLSGANLQSANLRGANLRGANLQSANLSWAQLTGADLTEADLTGANLSNADLLRVIMPDGTLLN